MRFPLAAAALYALCLTGCMKYTLTPERPTSMPRAETAPLPLKVGVIVEGPPAGSSRRVREDEDAGKSFAAALRESRLFSEVFYPLPETAAAASGVDLVMRGRFSSQFVQDPMQAPKIFLVCFTGFVTGALMSETSHHLAEGALSVAYPDGRLVKTYAEKADVTAVSMVSMFAEQKTMKLGPPAARENLVAKLVSELIADRESFARREAPSRPAPGPAAVAAAEPAPAPDAPAASSPDPSPEPAAAPKVAVEAPPVRRPLTPDEEAEIDAQLLP